MTRLPRTKLIEVAAGAVIVALAVALVASQVFATGLTAATYTKKTDTIIKTAGGPDLHLVEFTVTGGSGDTYLTGGVTPSATATGLGFTGFKILSCEPVSVAWTAYTTVARAVVMRSTNVQLANSTSLNGVVINCRALAY